MYLNSIYLISPNTELQKKGIANKHVRLHQL